MLKYTAIFFLLVLGEAIAQNNILVVHSYEQGSWTTEGTRGVSKVFQGNKEYKVNEFIYDYIKYRGTPHFLTKIKKTVSELTPKAIIVFDDEAADDLLPYLNSLGVPVVLTGINREPKDTKWYLEENHKNRNFTGILERYPFEQSLKMLKKIKPSVKKITILSSNNETSKIVSSQVINNFKKYNNEFNGVRLNDVVLSSSWEVWQKTIRESSKTDAFWILVPWNVNDKSGKEVDIRIIGDFYREFSKVPEIGIVNISDKLGFVSSFSVNAEDLGIQAANITLNILQTKVHPRNLSFVENSMVRFVINKKRADQLGITIPSEFLDFAKIERKIPREYFR